MNNLSMALPDYITKVGENEFNPRLSAGTTAEGIKREKAALYDIATYVQGKPFKVRIYMTSYWWEHSKNAYSWEGYPVPRAWIPFTNGITHCGQLKHFKETRFMPFPTQRYSILEINEENSQKLYKKVLETEHIKSLNTVSSSSGKGLFDVDKALENKMDCNEVIDKLYSKIASIGFYCYRHGDLDNPFDEWIEQNIKEIVIYNNRVDVVFVSSYNDFESFKFSDFKMNLLPNNDYIKALANAILKRLNAVGLDYVPYYIRDTKHCLNASQKKPTYNGKIYGIVNKKPCAVHYDATFFDNKVTIGLKASSKDIIRTELNEW